MDTSTTRPRKTGTNSFNCRERYQGMLPSRNAALLKCRGRSVDGLAVSVGFSGTMDLHTSNRSGLFWRPAPGGQRCTVRYSICAVDSHSTRQVGTHMVRRLFGGTLSVAGSNPELSLPGCSRE